MALDKGPWPFPKVRKENDMADLTKPDNLDPNRKKELTIEEFSIVELEDRLEFLDRSNRNCGCPSPT
jgi:hypothetical protein